MGITELRASLAPRRKISSSFFVFPSGPGTPMVPSANARFTTSGMSTSVESATPNPILKLRSKKPRRVRMLKCCIGLLGSSVENLLFLEAMRSHQHGNHAADTRIVNRAGNAAHGQAAKCRGSGTVVGGVQEIDRRGPINGQIRLAFAGEQQVQEIIRHGAGISQTGGRQLQLEQGDGIHDTVARVASAALTGRKQEGLNITEPLCQCARA